MLLIVWEEDVLHNEVVEKLWFLCNTTIAPWVLFVILCRHVTASIMPSLGTQASNLSPSQLVPHKCSHCSLSFCPAHMDQCDACSKWFCKQHSNSKDHPCHHRRQASDVRGSSCVDDDMPRSLVLNDRTLSLFWCHETIDGCYWKVPTQSRIELWKASEYGFLVV